KGRLTIGLDALPLSPEIFAEREFHDVGDVAETSRARNSIAAQEFGSDYTDPYEVRAGGLRLALGNRFGARWRLDAAYETHRMLQGHAEPSNGRYEPVPAIREVNGPRLTIEGEGRYTDGPLGTVYRLGGEL